MGKLSDIDQSISTLIDLNTEGLVALKKKGELSDASIEGLGNLLKIAIKQEFDKALALL